MLAIRNATVVFQSRVAGKGHMQRRNIGGEVHPLANALDQQQRGDLADTGLDRLEPDQLTIELIEHVADADLVESRRRSTCSEWRRLSRRSRYR